MKADLLAILVLGLAATPALAAGQGVSPAAQPPQCGLQSPNNNCVERLPGLSPGRTWTAPGPKTMDNGQSGYIAYTVYDGRNGPGRPWSAPGRVIEESSQSGYLAYAVYGNER